ncbi:hypothetical protein ACJ6WF_25960 [Streptomyces sp. MMS24-I2-30]|uniref:hypothetical protein n=1 Tax=Streptomyces sp. MMS24-I2-30 TaxID=3351564 RepID=UPI003896BC1D
MAKGKARELMAWGGVLAALLGLLLWGASSAVAGGPTSVLVASPQSEEATARYYSDEEYEQLQALLGPENKGSRTMPPEATLSSARQINVTWLAHDISPWRVDRVFPLDSPSQEIWIHTAANLPTSGNGYWHQAEQPTQLRSLLGELGVMGRRTGQAGYSGIFPAPWQSSDTPDPSVQEDQTTTTVSISTGPEDDGTDWWWAIPGAAAGAALALVLRRFLPRLAPAALRRGSREPGPRQELRDM